MGSNEGVAPANAAWQARLIGAVKGKLQESGVEDEQVLQQASEALVQTVLVELIKLGSDLREDSSKLLEDAEKDSEIARGRIHAGNMFQIVGETILGVVVEDET